MTREELHRGFVAKAITDSEDFKALVGYIRADLFSQFSRTAIGDDVKLKELHTLSYGIEMILSRCDRYIDAIKRPEDEEETQDEA